MRPSFDARELTLAAQDERPYACSTPRRIWSSSIDSNRALKLPSPKPSSPLRWMNSKKIGPITVLEKICSRMRVVAAVHHAFAVDQDAVLFQVLDRLAMVVHAGEAISSNRGPADRA